MIFKRLAEIETDRNGNKFVRELFEELRTKKVLQYYYYRCVVNETGKRDKYTLRMHKKQVFFKPVQLL